MTEQFPINSWRWLCTSIGCWCRSCPFSNNWFGFFFFFFVVFLSLETIVWVVCGFYFLELVPSKEETENPFFEKKNCSKCLPLKKLFYFFENLSETTSTWQLVRLQSQEMGQLLKSIERNFRVSYIVKSTDSPATFSTESVKKMHLSFESGTLSDFARGKSFLEEIFFLCLFRFSNFFYLFRNVVCVDALAAILLILFVWIPFLGSTFEQLARSLHRSIFIKAKSHSRWNWRSKRMTIGYNKLNKDSFHR